MFPPDTGVAVLTGDIQTDNYAKRVAKYGFPVRQITTAGSCHLDARMAERQLEGWDLEALDYLFIENVGNLVCPSSYHLGEHDKIVILSVTEGEDKPLKYPGTFSRAGLVILNKIDLVPRNRLLGLIRAANERVPYERTFMISALKDDGVADVRDYFAGAVAQGPWHYPADEVSDVPLRLMAAEITREKLYLRLHQELPYQSTVETDAWQERKDGSVRIEQTVFVARDGQKKIVLGEGGRMIKSISMEARKEIAAAIEKPVHLFLHVKVREDWQDDPERYRAVGLEFPKG